MSDLANQPAFPTPDCSNWDGPSRTPGMTLREYLAGLAMQGLLAGNGISAPKNFGADAERRLRAKVSVMEADALIAELEKSK